MTPLRAEWRPYRDDPLTSLGWVKRAFRRPSWLAALATGGLMLGVVVFQDAWAWLLFLNAAVLTLVLACRGERPIVPEAYDLVPKLPGVDRFLVDVFVRRRGVLIGEDQGLVSEIDGWLYFEGLRSGFSLKGPDVLHILRARQGAYEVFLRDGATLLLRPHADSEALGYALLDWRNALAPSGGSSLLPPTRPHGSALPETVARLAAGAILLMVGAFGLASMFLVGLAAASTFVLGTLLVPFGIYQLTRGLRGMAAPR